MSTGHTILSLSQIFKRRLIDKVDQLKLTKNEMTKIIKVENLECIDKQKLE